MSPSVATLLSPTAAPATPVRPGNPLRRTGGHDRGLASGGPDAIAPRRSTAVIGERMHSEAASVDVAALYKRYGDLVYGRCLGMLRNDADAIDATQEVFLRVHRHAQGFRGQSKPSTWLYRIATNVCLNVIRSRNRHPEDPVEEIQDHAPAPVGDSVLDTLALRQLVEQLLFDWDERTQQCVVYHYMDGMTHDEVGELLGVSGAAVRKRLARFRTVSQVRFPAWAGWRGDLEEDPR